MINKGEVVMAMWIVDFREYCLSVQPVPLKGGGLTIETIGQGHPADKRMSDLYDIDMYFFMAGRDPFASDAQKRSAAHYSEMTLRQAKEAIKASKVKKPLH